MIVADTNVLSEPLRPHPEPRVLNWLTEHRSELAITAITVGELLYGAHRLPHGKRRSRLLAAIEALVRSGAGRVLPYDQSSAEQYAVLRARLESIGRTVTVEDGMIAATCRAGGHELATRNERDFADAGVRIHNPWAES